MHSQVSDGAAVTLLMSRREALKRGLPVMGVFRSFAAVGVDPAIMGVGPAVAIPAALKMAGLTLDDIDVYEINEAFASQALYCVRHLGIDPEKVRCVCWLTSLDSLERKGMETPAAHLADATCQ
jgi:acetyl-CoA acyltransferase 1